MSRQVSGINLGEGFGVLWMSDTFAKMDEVQRKAAEDLAELVKIENPEKNDPLELFWEDDTNIIFPKPDTPEYAAVVKKFWADANKQIKAIEKQNFPINVGPMLRFSRTRIPFFLFQMFCHLRSKDAQICIEPGQNPCVKISARQKWFETANAASANANTNITESSNPPQDFAFVVWDEPINATPH